MKTSLATSVGSLGVAGAFIVLVQWALSMGNISMPDTVATALVVVAGSVFHWAALRFPQLKLPDPGVAVEAPVSPVEAPKPAGA